MLEISHREVDNCRCSFPSPSSLWGRWCRCGFELAAGFMPSLIHSYSRYAFAVSSYLVLVLGTKEAKVIGLVPILEADCHLVS